MCRSVLSQLTSPKTRPDVLSWYVTLSAIGSTVGSEVSGRIIEYLQTFDGWTLSNAYHTLFWILATMGVVNAILVWLLSKTCESESHQQQYSHVDQHESEDESIELVNDPHESTIPLAQVPLAVKPEGFAAWLTSWMGEISGPTLAVMWKLWILLALDSLADGMVPYSLTNCE